MNTRITLDSREEKAYGLMHRLRKGNNVIANAEIGSISSTNDESSGFTVNKTYSCFNGSNKRDKAEKSSDGLYVLSNGKIINRIGNENYLSNSDASSPFSLLNHIKNTNDNKQNNSQSSLSLLSVSYPIISSSSLSSSISASFNTESESDSYGSNYNNDVGFRHHFIKRNKIIKSIQTNHSLDKKQKPISMHMPILNVNKSFKEYHLLKSKPNPHYPINEYLPKKQINNEEYKLNLFCYYRNPSIPDTKSVNCKFSSYYDSAKQTGVLNLNKRSYQIISERKIYSSEQPLYDYKLYHGYAQNTKPFYFKFYYDRDIGFERKWQKPLKKSEMDDDVDTEDDILKGSERRVLNELFDAIDLFKKNKRNCRNYDCHHL